MGFEMHLTRRKDWWAEEDGPAIGADEWLALVAEDDSLTLAPSKGNDYFVEWKGTCRHGDGTWFNWDYGQIYTKGPDEPIMAKMLEMAAKLGATMQDDDGNIYEDSSGYPVGVDRARYEQEWQEHLRRANRPWWKFW